MSECLIVIHCRTLIVFFNVITPNIIFIQLFCTIICLYGSNFYHMIIYHGVICDSCDPTIVLLLVIINIALVILELIMINFVIIVI